MYNISCRSLRAVGERLATNPPSLQLIHMKYARTFTYSRQEIATHVINVVTVSKFKALPPNKIPTNSKQFKNFGKRTKKRPFRMKEATKHARIIKYDPWSKIGIA